MGQMAELQQDMIEMGAFFEELTTESIEIFLEEFRGEDNE